MSKKSNTPPKIDFKKLPINTSKINKKPERVRVKSPPPSNIKTPKEKSTNLTKIIEPKESEIKETKDVEQEKSIETEQKGNEKEITLLNINRQQEKLSEDKQKLFTYAGTSTHHVGVGFSNPSFINRRLGLTRQRIGRMKHKTVNPLMPDNYLHHGRLKSLSDKYLDTAPIMNRNILKQTLIKPPSESALGERTVQYDLETCPKIVHIPGNLFIFFILIWLILFLIVPTLMTTNNEDRHRRLMNQKTPFYSVKHRRTMVKPPQKMNTITTKWRGNEKL
jgi:hypothetical protein